MLNHRNSHTSGRRADLAQKVIAGKSLLQMVNFKCNVRYRSDQIVDLTFWFKPHPFNPEWTCPESSDHYAWMFDLAFLGMGNVRRNPNMVESPAESGDRIWFLVVLSMSPHVSMVSKLMWKSLGAA